MNGKIQVEITAEFEPEDMDSFNKAIDCTKEAVEKLREANGEVEASAVIKGDLELDINVDV
jgi:hypothetical protein